MEVTPQFVQLFRRTLIALILCAALVTICYFFIDRPVAFFVYDHKSSHGSIFDWLTYPPPILEAWAPAVLAALMIRRAWGPFHRWEKALLAASVGLILADQFRQSLAFVFGRYWPETWINNNPSLIRDDAYGFHPLHGGSAYGSFPSGHMARILAPAAVVWLAYPRWRWASVVTSIAVATGLIGMDYHFVGDVIAGAFIGAIVGTYCACFAELYGQSGSTC